MAKRHIEIVSDRPGSFALPNSDEFVRTLAHVTWLMTLSDDHKDRPISFIERHVSAPLVFKQVRVFTKGKQPLAAITWAYASTDVKLRLNSGGYLMRLEDWRSGAEVVVVDCISPLVPRDPFVEEFWKTVRKAQYDLRH